MYRPIYLSICLSIWFAVCLSICLPVCLPVCLSLSVRPCLVLSCLVWPGLSVSSRLQKMVEPPSVSSILTSKCASCHNGMHFFDIRTSKSGLRPACCFEHFDLEMCFPPQREGTFSTSELPKMVRHPHVLNIWTWKCASRHAFLSTSKVPKVVRTWCVLYISTWKFALRNNSVQFLFLLWPDGSAPAALASLLFHPPHLEIIRKTQCFATFLTFHEPVSSFF